MWNRARTCGAHEVETLGAPAPADDRPGEAGIRGGVSRTAGLGVAGRWVREEDLVESGLL